jgi:hypothetical protein
MNRFSIGNKLFDFQAAGRFIDDPETVRRLMSGVRQERAALGLGIAGTASMALGFGLLFGDINGRYDYGGTISGLVFLSVGGALNLSAIIIGINGAMVTRNSILFYNSYYARSDYSHMRLDFLTPTPGGIGMQLTF